MKLKKQTKEYFPLDKLIKTPLLTAIQSQN